MEQKFVANKAVIVNAQGKILLVRDAGKDDHTHAKGRLDFPGGRMDHNETPHEGLLRELKEEIGVEAQQVIIERPILVGRWGVEGDVVNKPIIGIFYLVRPVGELEITLSEEHTEYYWMDPHQPYTEDMPEGVRRVVDAYTTQMGIVTSGSQELKGHEGFGLIQCFTGNGKGKTTAALGEVMRAVGAGKSAAILFFDKGGEHYAERAVLTKLGVEWEAFGRDRIDASGRFDFSITQEDRTLGAQGVERAKELLSSGTIDLVVLDEINSSTALGFVNESDVLDALAHKASGTEVVLTGRNAPEAYKEVSHLVTEMRLHKHYFYNGVAAREGLDY